MNIPYTLFLKLPLVSQKDKDNMVFSLQHISAYGKSPDFKEDKVRIKHDGQWYNLAMTVSDFEEKVLRQHSTIMDFPA